MGERITDAINNKSGGKLTTKNKSDEGFILTATAASLKADDKDKPKKLRRQVGNDSDAIGSTAKAFNGSSGASMDGVGNDVQKAVPVGRLHAESDQDHAQSLISCKT